MKKKIITLFLICALAVSVFSGCVPVDREQQESYRQLGLTKLQDGEYELAVENFQKALDESLGRIGAEEVDICYYKALAQYKAGQVQDAIDTYTALIEYDEKNADAYFLRGSAYLQYADSETDAEKAEEFSDKGIEDYEKAISLDGKNYNLYLGIHENLKAHDKEELGEQYLSMALSLECDSAQEYCDQGYVYLVLEQYDKAETLLATAVEKGCDEAILYQAQLYQAKGDEEQARSLLQTYTAKYPEDVDALHQAGILAINAGQYSEAVNILEQAYSYAEKGTQQELQKNLIYAYEYNGQFTEAYELIKEYVKLYPGDSEAAREYEFLKTRTGTSKTPAEREAAQAGSESETSEEVENTVSNDAASEDTDAESTGAEDTSSEDESADTASTNADSETESEE